MCHVTPDASRSIVVVVMLHQIVDVVVALAQNRSVVFASLAVETAAMAGHDVTMYDEISHKFCT